MIKLKLKRRKSGKEIKKAKRLLEFSAHKVIKGYLSYCYNKPVKRKKKGIKNWLPIYQIKSINPYAAQKLADYLKSKGKNGQLQRLYKIQPEIDPKVIREKEHQYKVDQWQRRLRGEPPF